MPLAKNVNGSNLERNSFMRKKNIRQSSKKLEEYYCQFPNWYWKYGLHDAVILSISELELAPDWKSKNPRRNCLEICLDSSNALYEQDICKICLYNYKIKTPDFNFNDLEEPWWMGDALAQLPNKHYLLEISIETARENYTQLAVEFEIPEIQRN